MDDWWQFECDRNSQDLDGDWISGTHGSYYGWDQIQALLDSDVADSVTLTCGLLKAVRPSSVTLPVANSIIEDLVNDHGEEFIDLLSAASTGDEHLIKVLKACSVDFRV